MMEIRKVRNPERVQLNIKGGTDMKKMLIVLMG